MNMKLRWIALALVAATAPAAYAQADQGNFIVRARAVHLDSADKDSTGLGLTINNKTIPEVDITYFFSPNLAAELILTYPQKQKVYSNGSQIGTFKHLPPTLSLQYHVTGMGSFRPYVGLGVNYTNISAVDILDGAVGLKHNSLGLAAQVGADIPLGGGWLINLDAKKVQIGTKVYLSGADKGKFKVDPTLLAIGVGKRF
jgi:outer membrane protein